MSGTLKHQSASFKSESINGDRVDAWQMVTLVDHGFFKLPLRTFQGRLPGRTRNAWAWQITSCLDRVERVARTKSSGIDRRDDFRPPPHAVFRAEEEARHSAILHSPHQAPDPPHRDVTEIGQP